MHRLRGSRGPLSLFVDIESPAETLWGVFSLRHPVPATVTADGFGLIIGPDRRVLHAETSPPSR